MKQAKGYEQKTADSDVADELNCWQPATCDSD